MLELANEAALVHLLFASLLSARKNDQHRGRVTNRVYEVPTSIFVPIMLRPLILQRCHADIGCHLGVPRALLLFGRFYRWIGVEKCVRWWIRRCFMCQARMCPRRAVPSSAICILLRDGYSEMISLDDSFSCR